MGLKVGDSVKITHKTESRYLGWDNDWAVKMDEDIGKTFVVDSLGTNSGVYLIGSDKGWPIFSLAKFLWFFQ